MMGLVMAQSRASQPIVRFVDEYRQAHTALSTDVRNYENLKRLNAKMISDIKCKALPSIAKTVGLPNSQFLQQFLCHTPWSVEVLKNDA